MTRRAALATAPLADGQSAAEVTLSGGSGRAWVESPAALTVTDGAATAVITWSSPYYEYMRVGGRYYYPVNSEGNSQFEIPVPLDEELAVSALTVAMSQPHEIDYSLRFDAATAKPLTRGGLAPIAAAIAAGAVLVTAAGLTVVARRRARRRKAAEEKQG